MRLARAPRQHLKLSTLPAAMASWQRCLLLLVLGLTLAGPALGSTDEANLIHDLMERYEISSRPVANTSDPLFVNMSFVPIALESVDIDDRSVMIRGWMKLTWTDVQLRWDPADYGNLSVINMAVDNIWQPDIELYNGAGFNLQHTLALVYSNGQVLWIPPMSAEVKCGLSATWFPFDVQKCALIFGSWTYDKSKIDLYVWNDTSGSDQPVHNTAWQLLPTDFKRYERNYSCCEEPYTSIEVTLTLRRRACRYVRLLVLPMATLTILGLMTMLISPERSELRLLLTAIFVGTALLFLQFGGLNEQPTQFSVLTLLNGVLLTALTGLFLCNCLQLAHHRCFTHSECPLFSHLSGFLTKLDGAKGSGPQDKSEAMLLDATASDRGPRGCLDILFGVPLAFTVFLSLATFMAIPLF